MRAAVKNSRKVPTEPAQRRLLEQGRYGLEAVRKEFEECVDA